MMERLARFRFSSSQGQLEFRNERLVFFFFFRFFFLDYRLQVTGYVSCIRLFVGLLLGVLKFFLDDGFVLGFVLYFKRNLICIVMRYS